MLDKEGGENGADRIEASQEGCCNTVKAHSRDGSQRAFPLLNTRLIIEGAAQARQTARNKQGQQNISVFGHAAVLGGILVEACSFKLIPKPGFFQQHPDAYGNEDRQRNGNGHILVIRE